jgi:hypothetical protein
MIDSAASGGPERRHFFSVDVAPWKGCVYFSTRFIQKKTLSISRTLHLMHDGISFDKILPKQVGYFGT